MIAAHRIAGRFVTFASNLGHCPEQTSVRLLLVRCGALERVRTLFYRDEKSFGLPRSPMISCTATGRCVEAMYAVIFRADETLLYCQARRAGDLLVSAQCLTQIAFLRHEF